MELLLTLASVLLICAGTYFTCRFKAFYIFHPIKTVCAMPKSGIRQMLLSLGGTVGVGNIAGVSIAIAIGGSGSVLWMWLGAILAMALKYAEITLGMLYGGAPQYITKALGREIGIVFSVLLIVDAVVMGGMIQANAVGEAMRISVGLSPVVCGIWLSILVAFVFVFNIDLLRLSSVVVPIMSIGYVICALFVIAARIEEIPAVISGIFQNAFSGKAAAGGALGCVFLPALRQGIIKGLFSNEAGCGTAPMAHASALEKVPARQGLFGIFEVFADTIFMCTLTAFVILLTENGDKGGIGGCMEAFSAALGSYSPLILSVAILLFAFSAIVSFGYYGTRCLEYLKIDNYSSLFIALYCFAVFVGSYTAPLSVWATADVVVSLMLIVNTASVFLRRREVMLLHKEFYSHMGKRSQSAFKVRSFSALSTKKDSPMSEIDKKRGSM